MFVCVSVCAGCGEGGVNRNHTISALHNIAPSVLPQVQRDALFRAN